MKKLNLLLAASAILFSSISFSQTEVKAPLESTYSKNPLKEKKELVFQEVEKMPEFPGGQQAMMQHLAENLKYPKWEEEKGIQGKVVASFVIDKNGKVIKPKIVKSVEGSKNMNKEVIRVINTFPNWVPGEQDGEKVKVQYNLPVQFKL